MEISNPFSLLTFIAAPAILTNAASIMTLGTANRFARAIDRARSLSAQVEGKEGSADDLVTMKVRQLRYAERRALLLVRSLTSFYLAVGAFGAATLISLFGAAFSVADQDVLRQISLAAALCAGIAGVGGLVSGSSLLVWETRMTLRILREETEYYLKRHK